MRSIFKIIYAEIKKNHKNSISFWKNFNKLIQNQDLLMVSAYGFFLGIVAGSIASHFSLFMYLDYGLSESIAGLGFAVVQFGSILGRPGWCLICDIVLGADKRKTFLYIGFLFTATSLILGLFLRNNNSPINLLFLLAFLIGYAGRGWHGLFIASVAETVQEENVGIALGFSSFFNRLGVMLSPPLFGYIADVKGSYNLSWLLLGLIMLLASISQYLFYYIKRHSEL